MNLGWLPDLFRFRRCVPSAALVCVASLLVGCTSRPIPIYRLPNIETTSASSFRLTVDPVESHGDSISVLLTNDGKEARRVFQPLQGSSLRLVHPRVPALAEPVYQTNWMYRYATSSLAPGESEGGTVQLTLAVDPTKSEDGKFECQVAYDDRNLNAELVRNGAETSQVGRVLTGTFWIVVRNGVMSIELN